MNSLTPIHESNLIRLYEAASHALQIATTVDDIADVYEKTYAIKEYARIAADRTMEINAAELNIKAKRRLGEELIKLKEARVLRNIDYGDKRAQQKREYLQNWAKSKKNGTFVKQKKLREFGITNVLASESQRLACIPREKFDSNIKDWRIRLEATPTARVAKSLPSAALPRNNYGSVNARREKDAKGLRFMAAGERGAKFLSNYTFPGIINAGCRAFETLKNALRDVLLVERLRSLAPRMERGEKLGEIMSDDEIARLCALAEESAKAALEQFGLKSP